MTVLPIVPEGTSEMEGGRQQGDDKKRRNYGSRIDTKSVQNPRHENTGVIENSGNRMTDV